jgi:iron(III) transport system permease protein
VISPAVLEQPGRWRAIGLACGFLLLIAPSLPLLWAAAGAFPSMSSLGSGFSGAMARSLAVGAGAAIGALIVGFPCGLLAGLYRFPARNLLLGSLALPLLIPSFLWAIGLSMLRIELGLPRDSFLSGASGCVLAFTALGVPLVLFAVLLAVRSLPKSQIDAALLAGGEGAVVWHVGRATLPIAVSVSLLSGVLSLSDPGPGQILGFAGAATQILVSFSSLYDFELAARQCVTIAAVVLLVSAPLVWSCSRLLAIGLLPHNVAAMKPRPWTTANLLGPVLLGLTFLTIAMVPLAGLTLPAFNRFWLDSVLEVLARTGSNTLLYSILAGVVATVLALCLAICAARERSLRAALLTGLVFVFVLPPSLGALGMVFAASGAPSWLDPLLRSRFTVGAVLGMRLAPIAGIILVRAIGAMPPSWALAASVHGVPLMTYMRKVLGPVLAVSMVISVALVALVAMADVTTILLLQPPGQSSFPVTLFTVMANAPESMVASLCLSYIASSGLVIAGVTLFSRTLKTSFP